MKHCLLLSAALIATSLTGQALHFTPIADKQLTDKGLPRLERTDLARLSKLTDFKALYNDLAAAPHEDDEENKTNHVIALPAPDGETVPFRIFRYDLLSPSARLLLPEFISAYGEDTEGRGLRLALSFTPHGLNASVRGGKHGRWLIDPVFTGDARYVQSFYAADCPATVERECLVTEELNGAVDRGTPQTTDKIIDDCRLRTYEMALACTGEYFQYMVDQYNPGGTANDYAVVLSRMAVSLDRVNGIFREDLGIVFTLVNQTQADTIQLLYNDPATDPYNNTDLRQILNVNTGVTDDVIGTGNYNLGHVFCTGVGGLAGPGVCFDGNTAKGVSGFPMPEGDIFDVNLVAHEIGHQLGARHTFNTDVGSCAGNSRTEETAFEPGSGTTIMGYAGICSPSNVQPFSDAYFHVISLEEINREMQRSLPFYDPSACAVFTDGNTEPVVSAGADHYVPLNTPFLLTAMGSDSDGGTLTYCWEQYFDPGTNIMAVSGEPTGAETNAPLFRSRPPLTDPVRYFPQLSSVVNNVSSGDWESLPTVAQALQFRVTVRDGITNAGYGCPQSDQMQVQFVNTGTQYGVLAPNGGEVYQSGGNQVVSWEKAGTDGAPINCGTVDILLSTDGGFTYPVSLANGVANDGTESVTIPAVITSTARIMVRCATGIFFDISDADFSIQNNGFTYEAVTPGVSSCAGDDAALFSLEVASTQGYTGAVDLTLTGGLPAGATASFSPARVIFNAANVNTTRAVTLTIGNLGSAAEGSYPLTTLADDGDTATPLDLLLEVGKGPIMLIAPGDNSEQVLGEGAEGTNEVTFSTITLPGYERYTVSFLIMRNGGDISGSFTQDFSGDPGEMPTNIVGQLPGSVLPEEIVMWNITAIDPDGTMPDVLSCENSFVLRSVLPVSWLDFNVVKRGKSARLNWSVAQDETHLGFGVERRMQGTNNWSEKGYVRRNGPAGQATYTFTDETVLAGRTYHYRLRQEDAGGRRNFSDIRSVSFGEDAGLSLRPNPAENFVLLNLGGIPGNVRYELYNSLGQQVDAGRVVNGFTRINLRTLPTAVYQLVVNDDAGYREVARLVKR